MENKCSPVLFQRFIKPGGLQSGRGSAKYWNWMTWMSALDTQRHMHAYTVRKDWVSVQTAVMVFLLVPHTVSESMIFSDSDPLLFGQNQTVSSHSPGLQFHFILSFRRWDESMKLMSAFVNICSVWPVFCLIQVFTEQWHCEFVDTCHLSTGQYCIKLYIIV